MTTTIDRAAWLASLKPGDEVAYYTGLGPPTIAKVDAVTPSGRIKSGSREWNPDGTPRGSGRHSTLDPVAQSVHDEIDNNRLQWQMRDVVWRDVPLSKLRRIKAILEETDV